MSSDTSRSSGLQGRRFDDSTRKTYSISHEWLAFASAPGGASSGMGSVWSN